MKFKSSIAITILLVLIVSSCKQHQEARRPISHSSGAFMKKSIIRNKKLVASEEDLIKEVIKNNPQVTYLSSAKGYWYSYDTKNTLDTLTPKKGDVAYFDYEIKDLHGNVIYSDLELRPQTYYVDKQEIMMGLRDAIKLMHKTEKVNFLFPSHMGYGYHGDDKKIGTNQPLIVTVTLNDFKPEASAKKKTVEKTVIAPNTATPSVKKTINEITIKPTVTPKKPTTNQPKDTLK
ncbi:gliding motility-associated peptidyl-prolyl isomerase [Flavobacterium sp. 7E]|uniref:gliding motility-associated peptidyl-prolyl isomerase GldI n=1 Tax=Flavobacterium sp. 7E TaxID=2735898 RepID=UPI00156E19B8|nr:gliding motility-associated peptidyl-prolyl isomerase GldI [Flavobacterium sp. 7E]NRS89187.1 gliding motility-associated peptidyl-prolyl isomerase [Flavobacterium sp. 7E]